MPNERFSMGCWNSNGPYTRQSDYDYYTTQQYKLKLNVRTDADIIKWLEKQKKDPNSSIQGSIKKLIREEIKKSEKSNGYTPTLQKNA